MCLSYDYKRVLPPHKCHLVYAIGMTVRVSQPCKYNLIISHLVGKKLCYIIKIIFFLLLPLDISNTFVGPLRVRDIESRLHANTLFFTVIPLTFLQFPPDFFYSYPLFFLFVCFCKILLYILETPENHTVEYTSSSHLGNCYVGSYCYVL